MTRRFTPATLQAAIHAALVSAGPAGLLVRDIKRAVGHRYAGSEMRALEAAGRAFCAPQPGLTSALRWFATAEDRRAWLEEPRPVHKNPSSWERAAPVQFGPRSASRLVESAVDSPLMRPPPMRAGATDFRTCPSIVAGRTVFTS